MTIKALLEEAITETPAKPPREFPSATADTRRPD